MKKLGFTLAEVLITLVIIGVIAALTIPTLMQNQAEQATVSRVKQAHSILSQAYKLVYVNDGPVQSLGTVSDQITAAQKYLKVMKSCATGESGCMPEGGIIAINGGVDWPKYDVDPPDGLGGRVILDNGMSIGYWGISDTCGGPFYGVDYVCSRIFVDVDGPTKGPHTMGKDVFLFLVSRNGVYPQGAPNSTYDRSFDDGYCDPNSASGDKDNGYSCTAWVVYKGNMDYLHCTGLSWNGKQKC